ncbi:helix-turn-helix domain-containing protein [Bacteroides sp. 224]|uniref:helix-turn-helix domain-containing protein n=1 Tax=Bacteroides sp. 224 TaxID=2302936 RepID=UPI0013D2AB71|nr:helix-turn-helix transcriptional regulator [Bacteroides sp. 224]NDV67182.1 XRE family transcriptional regulator [Bacteroides sp. 224]
MELNRIKEVLDKKGIKQTWLAEKLGKSFSLINAYACNRQQPSLEVLHQIVETLQVSIRERIVENKK